MNTETNKRVVTHATQVTHEFYNERSTLHQLFINGLQQRTTASLPKNRSSPQT